MQISRRTLFVLMASTAPAQSAATLRIGANTAITGYSLTQAVELLRAIKFPVIEIHAMGSTAATPDQFPGFEFDRLSDSERTAIRRLLRGFEHVTAHLPYTGLEYFSPDRKIAEAAIKRIDVAIEGCQHFGVRLAVIHPKPGTGLVEQFRRWGDLAAKSGMRLALETGYPRSVPAFTKLIEDIAHPMVGATLDVGHQGQYTELAGIAANQRGSTDAVRAYNDVNLQLVERLGKKLFHLHVHDVDRETWKEHQPMGTGFVDYTRLIAKLRDIQFDGVLMLEIGGSADRMPDHLRAAKRYLENFLR